jgi:hypothetical protein
MIHQLPMTASLREGGTLVVLVMVVSLITTITCLDDRHHAGGMVSNVIMMMTTTITTTTIILIIGAGTVVQGHCLSTMISQGPATTIGGIHHPVVSTETGVLITMSTKTCMVRESLSRPLELAHGGMMGITMMTMTRIVTMIAGGDVLRISTAIIILDAGGTIMTITTMMRLMDLRVSINVSLTGIVAGISLQIIRTQGAS